MKLNELLRPECIRVGSTVNDKAMALCEIASLAKESPVLNNISEEKVLEALQEREILGATAFGHEIAVPHCRIKGIRDFVVGLLTVPEGVEFGSEDAQQVRLLAFIIAPKDNSDIHVRLLSAISQTLQDPVAVDKMIAAADAETLQTLFLTAARADVTEWVPAVRNMIHVFIQDKTVFKEILEAVNSLEGISLSVFDGKASRSYLDCVQSKSAIPDDHSNEAAWCIVAIVERRLSNEVIRRVETVTGSLMECIGVMVTIQELAYVGGSLDM